MAMSVEPQELLNRARELAEPPAPLPTDEPKSPCQLAMTINGTTALQRSADNIAMAMVAGVERWQILAKLLVEAAKAYKDVDESAAESLDFDKLRSPATPKPASKYQVVTESTMSPAGSVTINPETWSIRPFMWSENRNRVQADALDKKYLDVKTAAKEIHGLATGTPTTDPAATALLNFAAKWSAYEGVLQDAILRFRPFEAWRGTAVTNVERQFELHKTWLNQMAFSCRKLGQQAQDLALAHRKAATDHPTYEQVMKLYELLGKQVTDAGLANMMKTLDEYQKKSEEVRAEYRRSANLPLSPLVAATPPDRADGDLFKSPEEIAARTHRKTMQEAGVDLGQNLNLGSDAQKTLAASSGTLGTAGTLGMAGKAGGGLLSPSKLMGAASQLGSMAKGMMSKSSMGGPGGVPPLPTPEPPPHMSPASTPGRGGAGGGGMGGVGVPRLEMPLQPPSSEGSAGPRMTPASDLAKGLPLGAVPGGASGAGGSMGGAPMGGGMGQGKNDGGGKAKRLGTDEDAVYTEERPWTEPVIGIRPRHIGPNDAAPQS
jgi:hypothetical protein